MHEQLRKIVLMVEYFCGDRTHETYFVLNPYEDDPEFFPATLTPNIQVDGIQYVPESWIIACQYCGSVWAKRSNTTYENINWQFKLRACEDCGNGSLWDAWNKPWNRSLPEKLILREMYLLLSWYDHKDVKTSTQLFTHTHRRRI